MTRALVEGFTPGALALARLLAAEGDSVRLLGDDPPRGVGLEVVSSPPGDVDVAYLDVWTAEVDDRVRRLRESGARLSCLSDLLLERATVPTIGVTGTAGKSTTASFIAELMRRAASGPVFASATARSGNLWATEESLVVLEQDRGVHVLELTSSHLAFMRTSPHVAVVTSFWPDHLELHGSLGAYRRAKEQIVRAQMPADHVVVNGDDPGAQAFAPLTPATVHRFSTRGPVDDGVYVAGDRIRAVAADVAEVDLGQAIPGVHGQAAIAAAAAVIASGVAPELLAGRLGLLEPPPGRARAVGRLGSTILVDDGMAATPAKSRATLARYAAASVVLVSGGQLTVAGREVHASPEERIALEATLDEIDRVARLVVCFGDAGMRLAEGLAVRGVPVAIAESLTDAIGVARERADDAAALIVSPMYPIDSKARFRIAQLLTA